LGSQEVVEIRLFSAADAVAVSQLVHQVFDEHVAASFEPDGIAEMREFTSAQAIAQRARNQDTYVAWQQGHIVGVIQMREIDHIVLLFVRGSHMGRGIASALMAQAEAGCRAAGQPDLTVNSSLNAQTYYEKLGFVATNEAQRAHGFAYVPMKKSLCGKE
jgi:predicted N-acetyltransferase YhbS